jgi:LysR substrate binding domain.
MDIANRWLEIQKEVGRLHAVSEQLPLNVGSLASQNMAFLTGMFTKLFEYEPSLRLHFMQRHSDEMYGLVEKREIHVGFSLLDLYNPSVRVMPCYEEPMVGLRPVSGKSPSLLDKGEKTVRVEALDPEYMLYIGWNNVVRAWHEQHWDPTALGRVRGDNVTVLWTLLRDPRQWTTFPYSLAKACAAQGGLEIFRFDPAPPDRICYALTHKYPTEEAKKVLAVFNDLLMETLHQALGDIGKIYPNPILGE